MDGPSGRRRRAPRSLRPGAAAGTGYAASVVIGIDGSATSWDAFWWACGEARRLGSRAVAVFVSTTSDAGVAALATATGVAVCDLAAMDRCALEQASALRAQIREHAGNDVTFVHARGHPARELLRVAEEIHADMIVVGRSTKAWHQLTGSLSRYLIAQRKALVVVVP